MPRWNHDGSALAYSLVEERRARVAIVRPTENRFLAIPVATARDSDFAWSPDGRLIALVPEQAPGDVWFVEARSGTVVQRLSISSDVVQQVALSGGGPALWVTARDRNRELLELFRVELFTGARRLVYAAAGDVSDPVSLPDGRVIFRASRGGELVLRVADGDGRRTFPVGPADGVSIVRGLSSDGAVAYVNHVGPVTPPRLVAISLADGSMQTLFEPPLRAVRAPHPIPVDIPTRGGELLRGFLRRLTAGKDDCRPLTMIVHGGRLQALSAWEPTIELAARHGQDVLEVDLRGSRGHGISWERGSFADSVSDLMAVVDHAVRHMGYSPGRIAAVASSYGAAVACAALARRSDLFKATILISTARVPDSVRAAAPPLGPVTIIHGRNDTLLAPDEARAMIVSTLYGTAPAGAGWRLLVLEREGHNFQRLSSWSEVDAAIGAVAGQTARAPCP
jgi:dipeptidyl aminopeptidase/acylaminoacyl peptidase